MGSRHIARQNGFTLPQLLAVCACVFVLTGIVIVPSLRSLAQSSHHEICLSRLRAIAQASQIYSQADLAESAIPVHPYQFDFDRYEDEPMEAYEWGGKSGIGRNDFVGAPADVHSRYGTFAGFGPATRPLNSILYPQGFRNFAPRGPYSTTGYDSNLARSDTRLALDLYRCPADDGPPLAAHCYDWVQNPGQSSFDHFGTSFAANNYSNTTTVGEPIFSNSPYLRKRSGVPNPVRTIHYQENIGRWAWAAMRPQPRCVSLISDLGVDPGPTKTIRGWHGRDWTYNHGYVDGHAEKRTIYIDGSEDIYGYALHYFPETMDSYPVSPRCSQCAPGAEDCAGEPGSFERYECIIIRGDGWQLDTMPAPFICTGRAGGWGRPSYEDCVESDRNAAGEKTGSVIAR